jgi:hypothetical protein
MIERLHSSSICLKKYNLSVVLPWFKAYCIFHSFWEISLRKMLLVEVSAHCPLTTHCLRKKNSRFRKCCGCSCIIAVRNILAHIEHRPSRYGNRNRFYQSDKPDGMATLTANKMSVFLAKLREMRTKRSAFASTQNPRIEEG